MYQEFSQLGKGDAVGSSFSIAWVWIFARHAGAARGAAARSAATYVLR